MTDDTQLRRLADSEIVRRQDVEVYEAAAPVTLFRTDDPAEIVARATEIANALAKVIRDQKLAVRISGREHVKVEGWTLLGTMLGVFPYLVWSKPLYDDEQIAGSGWEARVEARTRSGEAVGAAEAMCLDSEPTWAKRDAYALRSMAQTRATSKALRQPLGFVMSLAGYEATPAEEMPAEAREETPPASPPYATDHQVSLLRAMVRKLVKQGKTEAELRALILEPYGVRGFGRLTEDQAQEALKTLAALDTEEIPF
jgi:hypothetical protein